MQTMLCHSLPCIRKMIPRHHIKGQVEVVRGVQLACIQLTSGLSDVCPLTIYWHMLRLLKIGCFVF